MFNFAQSTGLLMLAMLIGCTGSNKLKEPRDTLAEYVSRSMVIKVAEDRDKLADLVTGQAKDSLSKMTPEQFQEHFIDTTRVFLGLKVRDERPINENKYSVTYELSYKSKTSTGSEDLVTLKKHALLEKSTDGRWLISEVQNLKTNIEHQNEITL